MLQRATTGASGGGGGTWWNEAIPANSSVTINNVNNGMFYIKSSTFTDIEVCAIENGAMVEKVDGFLCAFNYNNGNLTIAMNGYAASGLHRGYYS